MLSVEMAIDMKTRMNKAGTKERQDGNDAEV